MTTLRRLAPPMLLLAFLQAGVVRAEFHVNVSTTGDQGRPAVATASDGSFVIAWHSNFPLAGGGAFDSEILFRRYAADGVALGSETTVPTAAGGLDGPLLAMAGDGSFVVVVDHIGEGIRFQRFDAAGAPLGTNPILAFGEEPALDVIADGRFVVSWATPFPGDVRARVFDASGGTLVPEVIVSATVGGSRETAVGMADDGSFVVAWTGFDTDGLGVLARRFDATGAPLGPAFVVNDIESSTQLGPKLAMASDGSFVVVWTTSFSLGGTVRVRRFDATGVALGPGFEVDVPAGGPSIALAPDGSFVIVFAAGDGDWEGVFARRFDASGVPQGDPIQVSAFETGRQVLPAVGMGPGERFIVAWESELFDGSGTAVLGQRLLAGVVDEPIDALKLVLVRRGTREKVVFVSKDSDAGFPPIGSFDDPATGSPGGALLELFSPSEGTIQIAAPPGAGLPGWSVRHNLNNDLVKFVNREAPAGLGAMKRMTVKARKVTKAQAALIGLPLAAPQTAIAVRLTMGARRSCALFDAPTIKTNVANKFVAVGALAASLPDCSDATMTGIP